MDRYHRQMILPEIGEAGQKRLGATSALVVGAGGLGCPVLQYLAAAGVGVIGIIDPDRVDLSNLQRQVLYTTADTQRQKASVAKKRLEKMNPDVIIRSYTEALNKDNILSLFHLYDIIVDGTDNFATKFLINDAAVKSGKPVVYGAIQAFGGQVSVFDAKHGPCYRCLHPAPPQSIVQNCAEAGVIGAVAGIVGTVQAMEVIKIAVRNKAFQPLIGKLWITDARTMETHILTIPKQHKCPTCSKKPHDIHLHAYPQNCTVPFIPEIKKEAINNAQLIDVRERHEWEAGHIAGAHHLPLSEIEKNPNVFSPLADKSPCVLYCQKGMRSKKAAEILMAAGFHGIKSLKGGYDAFRNRN